MLRRDALWLILAAPLAARQAPPSGAVPVANFAGVFKRMSGKTIFIEVAEGSELPFHWSAKTKFYKDKKAIKARDLKPGDNVTIDAKEALDATLDAVKVNVVSVK